MRQALGRTNPAGPAIRQITLDYPLFPRKRPLELTVGGKRMAAIFADAAGSGLTLASQIEACLPELENIPAGQPESMLSPHWSNDWIPPLDSMTIYALVRKLRPATYLEVGSGMSTKFARQAIKDAGLKTRILSIDPHPRAEIDAICDEVIRQRFEDIDLASLKHRLQAGDLVFIDNSHQSFQSSDVTVFFTEFLPLLPPGATWGLHDIFLPYDYPDEWRQRFYNEQYLLMSYLLGGHRDDDVVFSAAYHAQVPALRAAFDRIFERPSFSTLQRGGGGCWFRRKPSP